MRTDRITHLITVLERVSERRFNIETWRNSKACGTVCCAGGWAALDPVFNKQGLSIPGTRPKFDGEHETLLDFEALQMFFEISEDETFQLFSAYQYQNKRATPADVIARIRKLLADQQLEDETRAQVEDIEQAQIDTGGDHGR
jgi:hypothetical protein